MTFDGPSALLFSPGCTCAIASEAWDYCVKYKHWPGWGGRNWELAVFMRYSCQCPYLMAHWKTSALKPILCVQMKIQKSITKEGLFLYCNLSTSQVIQNHYRLPHSRKHTSSPLSDRFFSLAKRRTWQPVYWEVRNVFVFLLFLFESTEKLYFNLYKLSCQI
jgi:hypothetical protein